jgi:hypothetical protein
VAFLASFLPSLALPAFFLGACLAGAGATLFLLRVDLAAPADRVLGIVMGVWGSDELVEVSSDESVEVRNEN